MSTTRRSPAGGTFTVNILFLLTSPRTSKFHEILKLRSIFYIAIRVEAYKAQTCLTQCYDCQQFDHVWANCKQPPCCMWCGGGHLHKECPEKSNIASIPTICSCKLVDGEKPCSSSYRGRRHAKEEMQKKGCRERPRLQREGCSLPATPPQDYPSRRCYAATAAASAVLSCTGLPRHSGENECPPPLRHNRQHVPCQSVQAPNSNTSALNRMSTVVATIFRQI
jgi:hypothetical protein